VIAQRLMARRTRIKTGADLIGNHLLIPQRLMARRTRIKTMYPDCRQDARQNSEANGQKNKD